MKPIKFISLPLLLIANVNAQEIDSENNSDKNKPYPKHEIGFYIGAFPTIGIFTYDVGLLPFSKDPIFMHTNYRGEKDGNYEKMYHLGSYMLNYNYRFSLKHSKGVSLSWVGKHIDIYEIYPTNGVNNADTVNGRGWRHYFTLQGNYRYTYYRYDNVALYLGIHYGVTFCIRDKYILPKEIRYFSMGNIGNKRFLIFPIAIHFNALGIEVGKKYVFNTELGIGTQGLLKIGFRYKF